MKVGGYRLDIREEFVIFMVGRLWNKLLKTIVNVPSLEVFKDRLWFKTQCVPLKCASLALFHFT